MIAAGALGRPYIANAAATTATAWWTQGFIPEEDAAFKRMVADYEKASGDKIDYNITPFAPLGQKIVSAMTTGDVPDVISYDAADATIIPQNAWDDKVLDLTDILDTQKSEYAETVIVAAQYYNNVTKNAASTWRPTKPPAGRSISGGRWSRRRVTNFPMRPRPGMRFGISSSQCRRSCAKACATSMRWVCR